MAYPTDPTAGGCEALVPPDQREGLVRVIAFASLADGATSSVIDRLTGGAKTYLDHQSLTVGSGQDVAVGVVHHHFSTDRRRFVVAVMPNDRQNAREIVASMSRSNAAVIVVDARHGVVALTRQIGHLIGLVGRDHVALVVDGLDLVDDAAQVFDGIQAGYLAFAHRVGLKNVTCIPTFRWKDVNVLRSSALTHWYRGPTLLEVLETCELDKVRMQRTPLRMPIQYVSQAQHSCGGRISGGELRVGDCVRALPSGQQSRVVRIDGFDDDEIIAVTGQSVTITLEDEINISCGDVMVAAEAPAEVADQFESTVVWFANEPLRLGQTYGLEIGACKVLVTLTELKCRLDAKTLEYQPADVLERDGVGVCNIRVDRAIPFDAFRVNRELGGFILIDQLTNDSVGAGMLHVALRRAHNIHLQPLDVDKAARAALMAQRPSVLWFTGLSGAGKSTIANLVAKRLHAMGHHTYVLDGDNVRHGLNRDLGFSDVDRVENIRRIAEVARLMVDAGLIVITALISPFLAERRMARELFAEGEFLEIYVDTSLDVAERRDVKGLYAKARRGELRHFTGIDSPYEAPAAPELRLDTSTLLPEQAADLVIGCLRVRGVINTQADEAVSIGECARGRRGARTC